jgi:hypothetical protein
MEGDRHGRVCLVGTLGSQDWFEYLERRGSGRTRGLTKPAFDGVDQDVDVREWLAYLKFGDAAGIRFIVRFSAPIPLRRSVQRS